MLNIFYECSGMTSVTIGSGIESIGIDAFNGCSKLIDVYCYAINVPNTESGAFNYSPIENATLHVPAESVDAYKDAGPWKNFGTIRGIVESKVKLSKTKAVIEKGKTLTLKAKVYPTTEDQSVTWESSDPTIVKVASNGKIKGVKAGTAIITCTSNATGLSATCKVTVVKAAAAPSLEDVTDIEEKSALAEEFDVYDLNGRRVLNKVTSLDGLSDGVYIVNGKKVVIK